MGARSGSRKAKPNKHRLVLNSPRYDWKALPPPDPSVARRLLRWFRKHGRSFPWRRSTNPYHVLCCEVMLQRTRAEQVEPVYSEFRARYSTAQEFLADGERAAREIFEKLGLRWRARHFLKLSEVVAERYGGKVPKDPEALGSLPGVGQYAGTAVRVFAFGERATITDSNVLRVLGRYFGIRFPDHARRSRRVLEWAAQLAPRGRENVRNFNWALIDLGAQICVHAGPNCQACPLRPDCWYSSVRLEKGES